MKTKKTKMTKKPTLKSFMTAMRAIPGDDLPRYLDEFERVIVDIWEHGPHQTLPYYDNPPEMPHMSALTGLFAGQDVDLARRVLTEFHVLMAADAESLGADPNFVATIRHSGAARLKPVTS